jgi:hypothetical protein
MKKKIIGIIIGMLLCLTAIEIYPQTIKVKALVPDEVKLNYQKIHEFTQKLSNIVFEDEGILNGIRMGRYFGTPGDRYAGNLTLAWMEKFAKFYIDSHQMIDYPTKDIIGLDATVELKRFSFNLSKNGCEAIISNDECYLLPKTTLLSDYADYSDENIKVERFYPWEWNKLEDYESMFNISYTRFQYSDQNFVGELTYISNYTRATKNETFMKTHLIDCSDDEFNDTTNLVANSNGSAFILMRDNITNITNCELPVPGIAVTKENGSLLYNLTQNDSLYVAVFLPYENPIPDKGYMTIYTCPIIAPLCSPKLLLVTIDDATNWQTTAQTVRLCVRGVIVSDPAFDDRHWMTVPTGENAIPGKVWDDNPHNLGRNYHSSMLKPYYFINNTIYCNNGHQHKIFEWYEEPGDLYADYSGHQKDVHKNSYNVYCTISGSNPIHDKRVIVSGGHLDGFPGQMPIDDAIGSATMLGILKYMNGSIVVPEIGY